MTSQIFLCDSSWVNIKQIILCSKTTIQQYIEHRHMEAGLMTGLSCGPFRLNQLLSFKSLILTKHLTYIASQTCILNSKHISYSCLHSNCTGILLKLYKCRIAKTKRLQIVFYSLAHWFCFSIIIDR